MSASSPVGSLFSDDSSAVSDALHVAGVSTTHTLDVATAATLSTVELSPLARLTSTLTQLQQSDPEKYRQVAEQLAANLQNDAANAQSAGETTTADRLSQLAGALTAAAQNGELPNLEDLIALTSL